MTYRTLASIVVTVSILVLPFWIYIPILFINVIFFPFYWEGVLFSFLIDVLYGSGVEVSPFVVSPIVLAVLATLIILLPLRESLRSYV